MPTGGAAYTPEASVVPSLPAVEAPYPVSSANAPHGGIGGPQGTAAPTGTGATTAPYPEFTGAASNVKVGGLIAGVAGVAALLL